MHHYTIEKNKISRQSVTIVLIILSIIICTLLNCLLSELNTMFPSFFNSINSFFAQWPFLGFTIAPLSMFTVFKILDAMFNNWIWKIRPISRMIGLSNFSGKWHGKCFSSYMSDETDSSFIIVDVIIKQKWKQIYIESSFPGSISKSNTACIKNGSNTSELLFTYTNTPKTELTTHNKKYYSKYHHGVNVFHLDLTDKHANMISGEYFNNRGNVGKIELKKLN